MCVMFEKERKSRLCTSIEWLALGAKGVNMNESIYSVYKALGFAMPTPVVVDESNGKRRRKGERGEEGTTTFPPLRARIREVPLSCRPLSTGE